MLVVVSLSFAADIPVGPGESIAGAASSARDGDVVVVDQGADASGIVIANDVRFTIRSADQRMVDVPAMRLSGVELTLERVRVVIADRGAYNQGIAAYDTKIFGEDLEFSEDLFRADMGVLLDGATFDVSRLRADGFSAPILYLESPSAIRLTDARISGMKDPIAVVSASNADTPLEIDGGVYRDNPAQYGLFLYQGGGSVTIDGAEFIGNGTDGAQASVMTIGDGPAFVAITDTTFCGNVGPSVEIKRVGEISVHRSWFSNAGDYDLEMSSAGPMTVTHSTFTGALISASAAVDFTNDLFVDVDPLAAVDGRSSHVGWFGTSPASWVDEDAVSGDDPGFHDAYQHDDCDTEPRLAAGSPAIDAGDPALELEDGDVGAPDLGRWPFVADEVDDTDVVAGKWLIGGAGCATSPGQGLAILLALLAVRRR